MVGEGSNEREGGKNEAIIYRQGVGGDLPEVDAKMRGREARGGRRSQDEMRFEINRGGLCLCWVWCRWRAKHADGTWAQLCGEPPFRSEVVDQGRDTDTNNNWQQAPRDCDAPWDGTWHNSWRCRIHLSAHHHRNNPRGRCSS
jgi:hypothetical protein